MKTIYLVKPLTSPTSMPVLANQRSDSTPYGFVIETEAESQAKQLQRLYPYHHCHAVEKEQSSGLVFIVVLDEM